MIVSGYRRNKSGVGEADLRVGGGIGIEADARTIELYSRAIGTGGVYALNMVAREDNLLRNPDSRRYGEMYDGQSINSQSISPYIGYKADPYEKEFIAEIPRLDEIGGLKGFNERFKNRDGYNTILERLANTTISNASYGLGFTENETPTFYEMSGDKPNYEDVPTYEKIRSAVETTEFEDDPIQRNEVEGENNKMKYLLYTEVPGGDVYASSRNNTYESGYFDDYKDKIDIDGSWYPGTSIIKKTQKLFDDGKIKSMVSRFVVKDGDEQISRGRKLARRKDDSKKSINGYDSPYCRVWTSHNQYAKIRNLMTPQRRTRDTDGAPYSITDMGKLLGQDMRPNRAPYRLHDFTTRNDLGIIKVAPKRGHESISGEIKKCMFSIENLAWKDINFNAKVDGVHKTLTTEQTGPNGGRIMWFPPYNLRFTEQVSTKWDQNEFIGRGEKIHTYVNTERRGTLDFTILVDHPSRLNKWTFERGEVDSNDPDNVNELLRYLAGIDVIKTPGEVKKVNQLTEPLIEPSEDPKPTTRNSVYKYFVVFFPNNYTGLFDSVVDFKGKMLDGYSFSGGPNINGYETNGTGIDTSAYTSGIPAYKSSVQWHYWIDYKAGDKKSIYNLEVLRANNYRDTTGYTLNSGSTDWFETNGREIIDQLGLGNYDDFVSDEGKKIRRLYSFQELISFAKSGMADELAPFRGSKYFYFEIEGRASSVGKKNQGLSTNRANKIKQLLISLGVDQENIKVVNNVVTGGDLDVSSKKSKIARSVVVKVYEVTKNDEASLSPLTETEGEADTVEAKYGQDPKEDRVKNDILMQQGTITPNIAETNVPTTQQGSDTFDDDSYIYDNEYLYFNEIYEDNEIVKKNIVEKVKYFHPAFHSITPEGFNSRLTFLQQCMRQGPTVSAADAAGNPHWAGNLSFGRAPYCVLRIGDFYNTKICIDSLNITYEGDGSIPWDLNNDGIGVQPMLANVTMSFTFIGGQDLSGPIARLQNAVTYNYYANTSVYDRHSDYRDFYITENNDTANIWSPVNNSSSVDNVYHTEWWTTKNHGLTKEQNVELRTYSGYTVEYDKIWEVEEDYRKNQQLVTPKEYIPGELYKGKMINPINPVIPDSAKVKKDEEVNVDPGSLVQMAKMDDMFNLRNFLNDRIRGE